MSRNRITITDPGIVVETRADKEILPIEGNAVAGSDVEMRAEEKRIAEDLAGGNPWAWCRATVRVTYKGIIWAEAHEAQCSYRDETEFREDPYFSAMIETCLVEINSALAVLCGPPKGAK